MTLAGSVRQTAGKAIPFLGRRTCHIWLLRYIPDNRVTHNVSQTCRFFGISRTQFYTALIRI